jgi:hypothetical protein
MRKRKLVENPFKPGAGHSPPYLAGRDAEKREFRTLLDQELILSNLVLTGLRGVGKTVLLEEFKPIAIKNKWLWVGSDLSESISVSDETIARRLITDLAVATSGFQMKGQPKKIGFSQGGGETNLTYSTLCELYAKAPGMVSDKLKYLLQFVWDCLSGYSVNGVIFAYDEAQTMSDHADKDQYPLSLLLDVFQSIQKIKIPFMLVLAGLPTLFPKLVSARTFAERMFNVQTLGRLKPNESKEAIVKPIHQSNSPVIFVGKTIDIIIETSAGYPFFIQFICKELFDVFLQQLNTTGKTQPVTMNEIVKKLDKDFFSGRWARATDRQRQLLCIIAELENCDEEFTIQDIVTQSKISSKPFSTSHVNQMLATLENSGLVYKNRHGRYSFAVPLLGQFIMRQIKETTQPLLPGIN